MKGGKYGNGTAGKGKEGWPPEVLCDGAVEEHGGVTHDNCTGVVVDGECTGGGYKVLSRKDRTEFARKWWWTVNARVVVGEQIVAKSGFENEARSSSLSVKVAPVLVRDLSPSIY